MPFYIKQGKCKYLPYVTQEKETLRLNHYGLKIHACPSYGGGFEKAPRLSKGGGFRLKKTRAKEFDGKPKFYLNYLWVRVGLA